MAIPPNYRFATLKDHIGHDFGESSPTRLDQPRIDPFAECTGDDQWIHVDVERARTQTKAPGGRTWRSGSRRVPTRTNGRIVASRLRSAPDARAAASKRRVERVEAPS